jgi:hypothetical protein
MSEAPILQRIGGRTPARLEIVQNFDRGRDPGVGVHGCLCALKSSGDQATDYRKPSLARVVSQSQNQRKRRSVREFLPKFHLNHGGMK